MLAIAAVIFICTAPAAAWEEHGKLTAAALAELPGIGAAVPAETLVSYLDAIAFKGSQKEFARELKLNPGTAFPYGAGEASGQPISLIKVLEAYADEPDGDMDKEVFAHYPELWKNDYLYMGGRNGPQSRVFRHVHWPRGLYQPPIPPSRTPEHDPRVLGEAPERFALFLGKSAQAFRSGHAYWGARFLAWALHYLEDLYQPFHAVQVPDLSYLRFSDSGNIDLLSTGRLLAYHHLTVDSYPTNALAARPPVAGGGRLLAALSGSAAPEMPSDPRALAKAAAEFSSARASRLGLLTLQLLPPWDSAQTSDPLKRIYGGGYWPELAKAQAARAESSEEFLSALEAQLKPMGEAARAVARHVLAQQRLPRGPASSPERMQKLLDGHRRGLERP